VTELTFFATIPPKLWQTKTIGRDFSFSQVSKDVFFRFFSSQGSLLVFLLLLLF
jgi:hypothetical protein